MVIISSSLLFSVFNSCCVLGVVTTKRKASVEAGSSKKQKCDLFTDKEYSDYVRNLSAPTERRRKSRFLSCKTALMEGYTYSVVDVEQLLLAKKKTTLITLESVVTGVQMTIFAPKCLTKHVLTGGDLDIKKVAMFSCQKLTYLGFSDEVEWMQYEFKFHQ